VLLSQHGGGEEVNATQKSVAAKRRKLPASTTVQFD